jgi:hypothetical protein
MTMDLDGRLIGVILVTSEDVDASSSKARKRLVICRPQGQNSCRTNSEGVGYLVVWRIEQAITFTMGMATDLVRCALGGETPEMLTRIMGCQRRSKNGFLPAIPKALLKRALELYGGSAK